MKRLNDALSTGRDDVLNSCVPSALSAITPHPVGWWLEMIRAYDRRACTRGCGVAPITYRAALANAGYSSATHRWDSYDVPLHVALRDLNRLYPGCPALLTVLERGRGRHAVAALGFMVADNTTIHPHFWADWAFCWSWSRGYRRWRAPRVSAAEVITGGLS
jgi:hypothetical protein